MASSSASASASASNSNSINYVFINHRGPDVKKTFASHLYGSLTESGFKVFLDRDELQKGDSSWPQIKSAIRASSVHIAIFSTTYAQSKWCLDELLLMLESMRESGSTIIPVFFGVKPSALRWTEGENGEYGQALRSLQNKRTVDSQPRHDLNAIEKWKVALSDAAGISRFELEAYNGDEAQLLADVVQRVREKVPKLPLFVSKYPTGLNDKIQDFEETVSLQQPSGEAKVVGIVGLGGVGKTTLANEFFNRARTNYRCSCFLSNVREKSSRGALNSLQTALLKDLAPLKDEQINNTDEGMEKLRKHLSSSHALIVLDNVDDIEQLEALISPAKDVMASSSLILVTSRDKKVLINWGIEESLIYKLEGLNPQHSTELFCWHAFHQPNPDAGFELLVDKFVHACNGLPLSLKVIGALLFGKNNHKVWEEQLLKISKIPPKKIQERLKISYDSLDKEEKQLFLHIACFFIGQRKDTAITIWDGSGWQGLLGFENLQDKCLVKARVEYGDEGLFKAEHIGMQDQLRDLGRYLANEEASRRRIWRVTENLSEQSPGPGIQNSEEHGRLGTELKGQGSCVESVFSVGQSPQLIILRWYNCPYSSLPVEI